MTLIGTKILQTRRKRSTGSANQKEGVGLIPLVSTLMGSNTITRSTSTSKTCTLAKVWRVRIRNPKNLNKAWKVFSTTWRASNLKLLTTCANSDQSTKLRSGSVRRIWISRRILKSVQSNSPRSCQISLIRNHISRLSRDKIWVWLSTKARSNIKPTFSRAKLQPIQKNIAN